MTEYRVRAVRWEHGWELHIDDDRVTQSHTLADAERMIRDYLFAVDGTAEAEVVIVPDVPGLTEDVTRAREATAAAAQAQAQAAARSRATACRLKGAGLIGADIAKIMGVSKGRVSQLTSECTHGDHDKVLA